MTIPTTNDIIITPSPASKKTIKEIMTEVEILLAEDANKEKHSHDDETCNNSKPTKLQKCDFGIDHE